MTKNWQERFDEMSEINEFYGLPYNNLVDSSIKQFISTLLEEQRMEVLKNYAKFLGDNCKEGETIEITIDKYLKYLINK